MMSALKKEICVVLILKAILIYGIWSIFFSQPLDERLTGESVSASILGIHYSVSTAAPQKEVASD